MHVPVETFFLAPDGEGTLQKQIQRMIADCVLSNHLPAGARLPSTRRLAEHLGVSRITVTTAYTELVAAEYLAARRRSGYFVSEDAPRNPTFDLAPAARHAGVDWSRMLARRVSEEPRIVRPKNWRDYPYPFIYGQVDTRLFDHRSWRACALQALGRRDVDTLTLDQYERDDPLLIEYIVRQILPRRGIRARPEEVLITVGAQNALWIAAQLLLTQRRLAVHENPCYPGLRQILEQTRCSAHAMDVDAEGLRPEELPPDVGVVFATPSHHCPTNATMPMARRRALLRRARDHGFVIVEDDYEFEISFGAAVNPALKAMDDHGAVIYVGSFSKSLFPGLRLGYIVADAEFVREARALRGLVLRHPPGHVQRAVAYFLSHGYYDAQVGRIARSYRRRRQEMTAALDRFGVGEARNASSGGSSFWLKAPPGVDTGALAARLLRDGVVIEQGRPFFGNESGAQSHYRLSYSSISSSRIAEGVRRIAACLDHPGPIEA